MPVYEYAAVSGRGKKVKGTIDAETERSARSKLKSKGLYPTNIEEAAQAREKRKDFRDILGVRRVSLAELAAGTRQFATLVGAGLPVVESISSLTEVTENEQLKQVFVSVRERVMEGEGLAKAMEQYPKVFGRLYINLVAAGEASGTLSKTLDSLADYLESQLELKRKVISALTYPALMLTLSCLIVFALFMFVIPKVVEIFERQNATLPTLTEITLAISHFLQNYWLLLIFLILLTIVVAQWYYRQEEGRKKVDLFLLNSPLFGVTYKKVIAARVASTLGTLLSSGVDLLKALDITKNIIGNVHVVSGLSEVRERVREGKGLASELERTKLFPSMLCRMVNIGEKSGELEPMLQRAGESYEREVSASLEGITNIIEPLLLIIVGAVVMLIVISVLMPMLSMVDQFAA